MEISALEVVLLGEWLINPPVTLSITVRAKLVRTIDGLILPNKRLTYEGNQRLFTEWAANDAKLLREEFDRCDDTLAQLIVVSVLMPYLLPE